MTIRCSNCRRNTRHYKPKRQVKARMEIEVLSRCTIVNLWTLKTVSGACDDFPAVDIQVCAKTRAGAVNGARRAAKRLGWIISNESE